MKNQLNVTNNCYGNYVFNIWPFSPFKNCPVLKKSKTKTKISLKKKPTLFTHNALPNKFYGQLSKEKNLLLIKKSMIQDKHYENFPFFNRSFDKKRLKMLFSWYYANRGEAATFSLVETLQKLGFTYAMKAGISLGVDDLKVPAIKGEALTEAVELLRNTKASVNSGNVTALEEFQQFVDTWHRTSENLKTSVVQNFSRNSLNFYKKKNFSKPEKTEKKTSSTILNPVYMMAFSGARGNLSQVRQLVGMRGLMADPQGQLVEFPIQSNFREGLTVTEYMISCYGARKGLVDTALRTAAAGYLTRRLVDVSHHQIVRFVTCSTKSGILLSNEHNKKEHTKDNLLPSAWKVPPDFSKKKKTTNKILEEKEKKAPLVFCVGRVLARDIPGYAFRNQEIDISLASSPFLRRIYDTVGIYIRSPLTCKAETGICQLCYGWSVSANRLVGLGEAVGIIAAQSIGEPGTQLTMRTFHTGGVFSGDIMEECRAKHSGVVFFQNIYLGLLVRTAGGAIAFCLKTSAIFQIKGINETTTYTVSPNTLLFVRQGEKVIIDSLLAQIPNLPTVEESTGESTKTILSDLAGEVRQKATVNPELASIRILAGQECRQLYFFNSSSSLSPKGFELGSACEARKELHSLSHETQNPFVERSSWPTGPRTTPLVSWPSYAINHLSPSGFMALPSTKLLKPKRSGGGLSQMTQKVKSKQLISTNSLNNLAQRDERIVHSLSPLLSLGLDFQGKKKTKGRVNLMWGAHRLGSNKTFAININGYSDYVLPKLENSSQESFFHVNNAQSTNFTYSTALLNQKNIASLTEKNRSEVEEKRKSSFTTDFREGELLVNLRFFVASKLHQNKFPPFLFGSKLGDDGTKGRSSKPEGVAFLASHAMPSSKVMAQSMIASQQELSGLITPTDPLVQSMESSLMKQKGSSISSILQKGSLVSMGINAKVEATGIKKVSALLPLGSRRSNPNPKGDILSNSIPLLSKDELSVPDKASGFSSALLLIPRKNSKYKNQSITSFLIQSGIYKISTSRKPNVSKIKKPTFSLKLLHFLELQECLQEQAKNKVSSDLRHYLQTDVKLKTFFRTKKKPELRFLKNRKDLVNNQFEMSGQLLKNNVLTNTSSSRSSSFRDPRSKNSKFIFTNSGALKKLSTLSGWSKSRPNMLEYAHLFWKLEDLIFFSSNLTKKTENLHQFRVSINKHWWGNKKLTNPLLSGKVSTKETKVVLNKVSLVENPSEFRLDVGSLVPLRAMKQEGAISHDYKLSELTNFFLTSKVHCIKDFPNLILKLFSRFNIEKFNNFHSFFEKEQNTKPFLQGLALTQRVMKGVELHHSKSQVHGPKGVVLLASHAMPQSLIASQQKGISEAQGPSCFARHATINDCGPTWEAQMPWENKRLPSSLTSFNEFYSKSSKPRLKFQDSSEIFPLQGNTNLKEFQKKFNPFQNVTALNSGLLTHYNRISYRVPLCVVYEKASVSGPQIDNPILIKEQLSLLRSKLAVFTSHKNTVVASTSLMTLKEEGPSRELKKLGAYDSKHISKVENHLAGAFSDPSYSARGNHKEVYNPSSNLFPRQAMTLRTKLNHVLVMPSKYSAQPISNYSNESNYEKTDNKHNKMQGESKTLLGSPTIIKGTDIPQIGDFINSGDEIIKECASAYCGQIIEKSPLGLTLRLTQNILYSNLRNRPAKINKNVNNGNWIGKGAPLVTLPYISNVTGDIVAGIPKIEQLFEARGEALDDTVEKIWTSVKFSIVPRPKAVRECFKEIGLFVVAAIQKVYSSQGVHIADKHLEVIIRQMTKRALIVDPGDTEFLPEEFVDLNTIECVNWATYGDNAIYRPRLIGITKASLTSNSFLSSASFQQTARVLERETILEKTDRLLGLKERVMMGALINAGTGELKTSVRLSDLCLAKSLSTKLSQRLNFFSRRKIRTNKKNNFKG